MTNREHSIDKLYIQIDGIELPSEVMEQLEEMTVENDLTQPSMFTLSLNDPGLSLLDSHLFRPGREVKIAAITRGIPQTIFVGETTALEPLLMQENVVLIVRGYDLSHRLYRGNKTRTFLKQSNSEIAETIARELGLRADVEQTRERYDYVMQDNQTDMEFLRLRAARIGYYVGVDEKTLIFRRAKMDSAPAIMLEWGSSLLSFRARLTDITQPDEVRVQGWDAQSKRSIVGRANQPTRYCQIGHYSGAYLSAHEVSHFPSIVSIANQPVHHQGEADQLAQALFDELAEDSLSAEGLCRGEPALKAGRLIDIKNVGSRLAGMYYVSATHHRYTLRDGYITSFHVNGHRSSSLLDVVNEIALRTSISGVVPGIVTNINDPARLGRIKVKFPWLNNYHESDWARLAVSGGGNQRGLLINPQINDEVLVAFEQGDISKPYVIGGLWNGKDKPPTEAIRNGQHEANTIKTRLDHSADALEYDSANQGVIQITTREGHTIKIRINDKGIQIQSQNHAILLDDQARIVQIDSSHDLEIRGAGGSLKITNAGVELSSNANLRVQANAMLDVKSNAILTIQGTLVKIN